MSQRQRLQAAAVDFNAYVNKRYMFSKDRHELSNVQNQYMNVLQEVTCLQADKLKTKIYIFYEKTLPVSKCHQNQIYQQVTFSLCDWDQLTRTEIPFQQKTLQQIRIRLIISRLVSQSLFRPYVGGLINQILLNWVMGIENRTKSMYKLSDFRTIVQALERGHQIYEN